MDQLTPGKPLASMDRDRALQVETHREGRTPGVRANVDPGNADLARRTGQSVCSSPAKHSRAHRSAKLVGSLRAAQPRPLVEAAVECHMGKAQLGAAELPRLGIAVIRLAPER